VLRQKEPRSRSGIFLFFSVLLLGVFFLDDRFRMILILFRLGISTKLIYLGSGSAVFLYGVKFGRYIKTTAYINSGAGRSDIKSLLQKSGVKSNQAATNNSRNFHFFDPPVNSQQSTVNNHSGVTGIDITCH